MECQVINPAKSFQDKLKSALSRFKVIKIEAVVSLQQVKAWDIITVDEIHDCLWPRVTLELDGKRKTFSVTDYHELYQLDCWENMAIRFCGGSKNSSMINGVRAAVQQAGKRIFTKVRRTINQTSRIAKIQDRIRKRWKKVKKGEARKILQVFFENNHMQLNCIRPEDIIAVYKDVKAMKVVEHVLNT